MSDMPVCRSVYYVYAHKFTTTPRFYDRDFIITIQVFRYSYVVILFKKRN